MTDPKEIIGEAGVKALADAGFTITPPKAPEPVRLVTMEESGGRWDRTTDLTWTRLTGNKRLIENAADNWLVRTVNKRIIEGLPQAYRESALCKTGKDGHTAYRSDLLRLFTGEGA